MSERTHWDGCWRGRTHHECAVARCEELKRERDAAIRREEALHSVLCDLLAVVRGAEIARLERERDAALARADAAEGILRTVVEVANVLKHVIPARTSQRAIAQRNEATILELIAAHFERFNAARAEEPPR